MYTSQDASFDAEQQGKCPICGRTYSEGCRHCEMCGKIMLPDARLEGSCSCQNPNCEDYDPFDS